MQAAEFLYFLGFRIARRRALKGRKRLPCRVVSIGNITTGGTGKTPAAIAVAEEASRRGLAPIILTRGYKGTATGPCFVTKGEGPLLSPGEAGDEPFLMAERLRGVPVVKCRRRYDGGVFALDKLGVQKKEYPRHLFILDDGFQHWGLQRDRDIVLIDADMPFGNGKLLPLGRLREPLSGLERADVVALTKSAPGGGKVAGLQGEIRRWNERCGIFRAEHRPVSCKLSDGKEESVEWLAGKTVFGFCAIGSPESFRATLLSAGAGVAGFRSFRDHYSYRADDILSLKAAAERSGAEWIVTTEKDIIKARNLGLTDNFVVLTISFSVEEGFYDEVLGHPPG